MATLQTLVSFNNANDNGTIGSLIADANGNLFGTTSTGGGSSEGTIFEVAYNSTTGTYSSNPATLYTFDRNNTAFNGYNPAANLYADASGNLFGETNGGGASSRGTVFELARSTTSASGYDATPTNLYSFGGSTQSVLTGVIGDEQGNLYGTQGSTTFGLSRNPFNGSYSRTDLRTGNQAIQSPLARDSRGDIFGVGIGGAIFEIPYNSTDRTFGAASNIGSAPGPFPAGLTADASGNLFGLTGGGNQGTIYEIAYNSATGTYASTSTTLYTFDGTNGGNPLGRLIVDANGALYGTTSSGGANNVGTVFKLARNGASATGYDATPTTLVTFNGTNGSNPTGTLIADRSGNLFGTTNNGGAQTNGTVFEITDSGFAVDCFATGTLIRTARGKVAVEDLAVGDLAVTASGDMRPVTWIGHRDIDNAGNPLPHDQQPIRIRAGAFAPGLPARDLRLSAGHPVLVGADADGEGGMLVPIMCLINGTSIARETTITAVSYWHVELDAHDILLAEDLPAESYFDMGSRAWFAGTDGRLVDPEFVPAGNHGRCRSVAIDGPLVDAERLRLDTVFAAEMAGYSAWDEADSVWLAA